MRSKQYKFADITINFDSKRIPLSGAQRETRQGIYRYYGAQGIIDYIDDFIFDGTYLLIAEDCENLKSKKQNIAQLVNGQFWVNNHAHIIQTNDLSDIKYLCYAFNNKDVSGYITGSAQPKLSQSNLNAIEFDLPPLLEQKAIAAVLSALDDKIELNNRINQKLEEMAQAIFKSWFVDFEPFQNAEFVESELGPIPKGWRAGTLSDICQYSNNKVSVTELREGNYYSTENMLPNKAGAVFASSLPSTTQTTACKAGDVLISNIRPYFKKILYCTNDGGCSTDVLCFSPQKSSFSLFLYMTLFADSFFDFTVAGSKGTKMPRGDKKQIMQYRITIPPNDVMQKYNDVISPMLQLVTSNKCENVKVAGLRDTLLPKLMSGELCVPCDTE